MLMMSWSGPSRPARGPTDADDARLVGFSRPARGQLMLMMPWSGPSRPARGPTDADDALVGALTPSKGAN